MPWKEESIMSLRAEFLQLALLPDANISLLARRFGISRKTAYKWIGRVRDGLPVTDRSRKPHTSPRQTTPALEQRVVRLRDQYPAWGARKLGALLRAEDPDQPVPAPSTITAILRRHRRLDGPGAGQPRDWQRFEHPQPNDLWQMDFKGHFALTDGRRCHPLTVLDDHSRFALGLVPCADERTETVRDALRAIFTRYGLPSRMLMDNGSPWGDEGGQPYTRLTVWLMKLGISVSHGRPYHPQTQGKDERFHRTLQGELLGRVTFTDLADCADRFGAWRTVYNTVRPHEALGLSAPVTRYRPSPRPYVADPGGFEYPAGWPVRRVHAGGWLSVGQKFRISKAFAGESLGLCERPEADGAVFEAWFGPHRLGVLCPHRQMLVRDARGR
jgi:transposase InsO family protein